jgi:hypothetical protein
VPRHEHRRDRDRNDRRIKLDCTDQPGDENHAVSGHAAVAPPRSVMNSRRLK